MERRSSAAITTTNASHGVAHGLSHASALGTSRRLSHTSTWFASKKYLHDGIKKPTGVPVRVWVRIGANLAAFVAIYTSLASMFVLGAMGAMGRRTLAPRVQAGSWQPLGQSCELSADGFVLHSCSPSETALLATTTGWLALGSQLAQSLIVPSGSNFKVTTCITGCTDDVPQASLELLIGTSIFPECQPTTGGQPVAAVGLVEAATVSGTYPNAAYLLTLFVDAATQQTGIYTNSGGSTVQIIDDVLRVLVDTNGTSAAYPAGINTVINSWPLGPRYPLQYSCISHIIDVSDKVLRLSGWHEGIHSHKAVVPGAACGHTVVKADELNALHIVLVVVTITGLGGDMLITFECLRGVLQRKPVLTYDILTGVEQRKVLLFIGAVSAFPGLLFVDVARMYHGTPRDDWFWLLSIVTLGVFMAWMSLLLVLVFQHVPNPRAIRYRLAPWSGSIFIYLSIPAIALSIHHSHEPLYRAFLRVPPTLTMNIRGYACACGAYGPDGIQATASASLSNLVATIVGCFIFSVAYAMVKLRVTKRKWFIDVHWTTDNVFLSARGIPYWFTGLPLDVADAIRIGNHLFCKPNMQVRMGLASVALLTSGRKIIVQQASAARQEQPGEALYVVSIYGLVPALVPAWCRFYAPLLYGTVTANSFQGTRSNRVPRGNDYVYSRGSCVG
ncbi:hypothetical protein ACHHYP_05146 [Achlya hypogyna]|uniref:Transmembrane protein n=1 Tax=Achlya hypogyna TaxID=1202772 RepID=A0A1V9YYY5_ACHHY|nr:hypothetical protein ACHHYP_05146 [Achlya hypogyna]